MDEVVINISRRVCVHGVAPFGVLYNAIVCCFSWVCPSFATGYQRMWVIDENEDADHLASSCAHNESDCQEISCLFDNARLLIRRHLLKQHPDQRVASGLFPPRIRGRVDCLVVT